MSEGYASEAQSEIPIDPALLAEQTQAQLEQQDEGAVHDALLEPELEYVAPNLYGYDPAAHLLAQPPEQAVASSSKQTLPPATPATAPRPPRSRKQRPPQHTVVVREDTCSFCQGGDAANKRGEAEDMVSCVRCGRSGHPSCLNMVSSKLIAKIKTYPWVCLECKTCEVCDSKGEDSRLMFCDGCDRGWHSYCLDPPLAKPPKGHWVCPVCRHSKIPRPKPDAARAVPSESPMEPEIPFIQTPTIRKIKPVKSRASELAIETPRVRKGTPKVRLESPVAAVTPEPSRKRQPKEKSGIVVRLRVPSGGGNRVQEVQEEEEEQVPFGGIIQGADADTMRTSIRDADREAFEKSRKAAEAKLGGPPPPTWDPLASLPATPGGSPRASPMPSSASFSSLPTTTPNRSLRDRLLLHQTATPTTTDSGFPFPPANPGASEKIKTIRFGIYDIDTWYAAPYPEEYAAVPDGRLWLCEFCLKYMKSGFVAGRHRMKCKARHPPGDEIYRDGKVSVFEVDGRKNKIYCQNLCLLAKMFLDHKTLYYDVEPFLFYVMTEVDEVGARFVGYFSKEKRSPDYNVSCIMTLPVRQRKGWGHLLIDFSYLLSRKEGRVGSPEKPLSALGALSYRNYWTVTVFDYLRTANKGIKMDDISAKTSMTLEDIHSVLTERGLLKLLNPPEETLAIAMPQRRNGMSRRQTSPQKPAAKAVIPLPSEYTIEWDPEEIEAYMVRFEQKEYLRLVPERLKYTPFLVTRTQPGVPPALAPVVPVSPPDEDADAEGEEAQESQVQDHTGEEQEQAEYKEEPPIPNGHTNGHSNGATNELEAKAEDEATLRLVAALSSPTRSLRKKRVLSPVVDDEPPRKRTRSSLPRAPDTPKRFTRTPTNPYPPRSRRSAGGGTPLIQQVTPTKSNGIKQLEGEWGDEDAEGEEWIE